MAQADARQTPRVRDRGGRALPASFVAPGVIFLGGVNLILIQWVLIRELTTLLLGTELVVLIVTIAFFVGLSVGYLMAVRLPQRWLAPLGVAALVLHLTLPVWFRLLVAGLEARNAYGLAFLVLPLVTPFTVSSFYSIFLPRFVEGGQGSLAVLYGVELLGSAAGVGLLIVIAPLGLHFLFAVYALVLLAILALLRMRPLLLVGLAALTAAWLALFPGVNAWSNTVWFEHIQELPPGSRTLFSAYTPYQKVDVMEEPDGTRHLYLDGLAHFGSYDGERLNVVMGWVPAALTSPENALVVGAGSMQMERMIAEFAGHVATVEIDPVVVEASTRYLSEFNLMDRLTNRSVIVDDAKHFIANTDQRYDLIATDVPAAYAIQTATLYSVPFYSAVRDRLTPNGIFVAGLTSDLTPDNLVARRVAASLLATFDEVMVVTPGSVGWSFAYAADELPFRRLDVEAALNFVDETEYVLYETDAVRAIVGDAPPITLDSMDIVLQVSADWIGDRLD